MGEGLVRSAQSLLESRQERQDLKPGSIELQRCKDANLSDPNDGVIQAVQFHPSSEEDRPLLLTAGLDKTLRFFQTGKDDSTKVHSIHCKLLVGYGGTDDLLFHICFISS